MNKFAFASFGLLIISACGKPLRSNLQAGGASFPHLSNEAQDSGRPGVTLASLLQDIVRIPDSFGDKPPSLLNLSASKPVKAFGHVIEASATHFCALTDGEMSCWGNSSAGQTDVPPGLHDVIAVSVAGGASCVLTPVTVRCWGSGAQGISPPPFELHHPQALKIAGDDWDSNTSSNVTGICVLDDEGVRCWPSRGMEPYFKNVDAETHRLVGLAKARGLVDSKDGSLCAYGDDGLACAYLGAVGQNTLTFPRAYAQLRNARAVTTTCAVDEEGFKCFDVKASSYVLKVSVDQHPHDPLELKGFACVLVDAGANCFAKEGSPSDHSYTEQIIIKNVPALSHPLALAGSYNQACAIDDNGLQCWGPGMPVFSHLRAFRKSNELACGLDDQAIRCKNRQGVNWENTFSIPAPNGRPFDLFTIDGTSFRDRGFNRVPSHICASQGEKLSCWFDSGRQVTRSLSIGPILGLAAYQGDVCILVADQIQCFLSWNMDLDWVSPPLRNSYLIKSGAGWGSRGPLCAADELGAHCYHLKDGQMSAFEIPDGLANIKDLSIGELGGCAVSESRVQCWDQHLHDVSIGLDLNRAYIIDSEVFADDNYGKGAPIYRVCVADEDGLKCESRDSHDPVAEKEPVIAAKNLTFLSSDTIGSGYLSDKEYAEEGSGRVGFRMPLRVPIASQGPVVKELQWRGLGAPYFSIAGFEADLEDFSKYLYAAKSRFLIQVASRIAEIPSDRAFDPEAGIMRFFYMKSLVPFMHELHSAYFQSFVTPRYEASLVAYGRLFSYASLTDFPRDDNLKKAALLMVVAALNQSKGFLASSDERRRLEGIIGLAGQAVSDPAQIQTFVTAYRREQALMDRLKNLDETRAFLACVDPLMDFLK